MTETIRPGDGEHPLTRPLAAALIALLLATMYVVSGRSTDSDWHTLIETIATLLALVVGIVALSRYYSRRSAPFLFLATGFLGTALLDGYHAVVTSDSVTNSLPSEIGSVAPWSWLAPRLFLAVSLYLNVGARSKNLHGRPDNERRVYGGAILLMLLSFALFFLFRLPDPYWQDFFIHRPGELLPGAVFLLALWRFLRLPNRGADQFDGWLLAALFLNVLVQFAYMTQSNNLFDAWFDAAHFLKAVSYGLVFVGLSVNMYKLFRQAEEAGAQLQASNADLQREIWRRQHVEERLRLFQDIVQNMQVSMSVFELTDEDDVGSFRLVSANAAADQLAGYPLTPFVGSTLAESFPDILKTDLPNIYREVIRSGEQRSLGEIEYHGDGVDGVFSVMAFPLPARSVGISAVEITERIEAERRLKERDRQLKEAQRLAQLGSWEWLIEPDVVTWSDGLYRIYGVEPGARELDLTYYMTLIHPDDRPLVEKTLARSLETGEGFDYYHRALHTSGEELIIHARGNVECGEDGRAQRMWGTAQDVTRYQRAVRRLQASEQRFRSVAETANEAIISADSDGIVTFWNKAAAEMFGYSEEEILGRAITHIMPRKFHAAHEAGIRRVAATGESKLAGSTIELQGQRRNGKMFPIELSLAMWDMGEEHYFTAIIRDVTERRKAEDELRRFTARLEASNRELEDFAYIASHDMQEPLRKIIAFGSRLRQRYADVLDETGQDYLERMEGAAARMQTLIGDLLMLSRVTTRGQPFEQIDLNRVVDGVLSDLETAIEQAGATVNVTGLPALEADPLQMRQLFQNLLSNSLKFTPEGVNPVVEIGVLASETNDVGPESVTIYVRDNGIGFEEKFHEKIFQPFQRLHARQAYKGTGMGLAICQKIVQRHGGEIHAWSVPDEGTTFFVKLPLEQSEKVQT